MPKPTKTELAKYKGILAQQLSILRGDVGSMKDEALRASEQDNSVDHLADQGTDNYDQSFMLGLIENEEETIQMIEEAIDRIDGKGEVPTASASRAPRCSRSPRTSAEAQADEGQGRGQGGEGAAKPEKVGKAKKVEASKPEPAKADIAKIDPWIPKDRLAYIPWARYCLRHQEDEERNRETA
jgi:RNA polymerase-binding transcription factor DksA